MNTDSDCSDPYIIYFIALQHMWRLKLSNPNQYTNGIGVAPCLSDTIETLIFWIEINIDQDCT